MRKGTGIAFVLLATLAVCQPTEAKERAKEQECNSSTGKRLRQCRL